MNSRTPSPSNFGITSNSKLNMSASNRIKEKLKGLKELTQALQLEQQSVIKAALVALTLTVGVLHPQTINAQDISDLNANISKSYAMDPVKEKTIRRLGELNNGASMQVEQLPDGSLRSKLQSNGLGTSINRRRDQEQQSLISQVRANNGGTYPFTVIKSTESFIIVNEEGDPLVVGLKNPQVKVEQSQPQYVIRNVNGEQVLVPTQQVPKQINVSGRLEIKPSLPPGVDGKILRSNVNYRANEVIYSPNQSIAWSGGQEIVVAGETCKIFSTRTLEKLKQDSREQKNQSLNNALNQTNYQR
jgi:hypothetical protein